MFLNQQDLELLKSYITSSKSFRLTEKNGMVLMGNFMYLKQCLASDFAFKHLKGYNGHPLESSTTIEKVDRGVFEECVVEFLNTKTNWNKDHVPPAPSEFQLKRVHGNEISHAVNLIYNGILDDNREHWLQVEVNDFDLHQALMRCIKKYRGRVEITYVKGISYQIEPAPSLDGRSSISPTAEDFIYNVVRGLSVNFGKDAYISILKQNIFIYGWGDSIANDEEVVIANLKPEIFGLDNNYKKRHIEELLMSDAQNLMIEFMTKAGLENRLGE